MGRQESPQLIERKGQVDADAQETSRASKYLIRGLINCFEGCNWPTTHARWPIKSSKYANCQLVYFRTVVLKVGGIVPLGQFWDKRGWTKQRGW